jgi:hypothetical protein
MLNISADEIKLGISIAQTGNNASFVFKNVVNENPSWQDFIDHINKEIHTPMDNPINTHKPFNERLINGVMLKSLFYMDARVRDMEKFSKYSEVFETLKQAIGKDVYPVSVFVNFVANEYNVPKHCDKRETLFWQCIGKTIWRVYPPSSEFPVSYTLEPGDIIYVPKGIDHEVIIEEPRASIAFGYENEV